MYLVSIVNFAQVPDFDLAGQFGSTQNDYGFDITTDKSGNLYMLGVFRDAIDLDMASATNDNKTSAGGTDIFVVKYSEEGVYLDGFIIGGTGDDYAASIDINDQNEILILGTYENSIDIDPSTGTVTVSGGGLFTGRYSSNLEFIRGWGLTMIGARAREIFYADENYFYILADFLGTVDFDPTVADLTKSTISGRDVCVAKYSLQTDECQWVRIFSNNNMDNANSITIDDTENVYFSGQYYGTGFINKLDKNGLDIWQKIIEPVFGGKCEPTQIQFNSGNLIIAGHFEGEMDFNPDVTVNSLTSNGSRDMFLSKYDLDGNYIDAFSMGSNSFDAIYKLINDTQNNLYITGTFLGAVDFDPSAGITEITAVGNQIFFAKYDKNFNYRWAFNIVGLGTSNYGYSLAVRDSLLWTTGYYYYDNDFDPSANTYLMTTAGLNNNDAFLARYTMCGKTYVASADTICMTDSIFLQGAWQKEAGSYKDTLQAGDCTKITTINLTVLGDSVNITKSKCGSYTLNSVKYTSSGIYIQNLKNIHDCDSVIILHLTIKDIETSVEKTGNTLTAPSSVDSYQWLDCENGNTPISGETNRSFTASKNGNYAVEVTGNSCTEISNCISITGFPSLDNDTTININSCNSYTFNNTDYTKTGSYTIKLDNSIGGDSTITLNLTINKSESYTYDISACKSYTSPKQSYDTTGVYIEKYINKHGCDSTVTLNIIITNIDTTLTISGDTLVSNSLNSSFQWLDCNDNYKTVSGETKQTFISKKTGNYALQISKNNCIDTTRCISIEHLGISNSNLKNFVNIYPNPTTGNVNIELINQNKEISVTVKNILGQKLQNININNKNIINIDIKGKPGIYIIEIKDRNADFFNYRIIKK